MMSARSDILMNRDSLSSDTLAQDADTRADEEVTRIGVHHIGFRDP